MTATPAVDVLALTASMPETVFEAGAQLLDDSSAGSVLVLVEGAAAVEAGGAEIARITAPGSFIGEIGALLGTRRTADVVALERTVARVIGEPQRAFADHPELGLELARQLAARLHRLVAYLADVREQYADRSDHLGMLDAVLGQLSARPPVQIDPGSDRSPDYF